MTDFLKLLYLDRSFISALYESETGEHPETKITSSDTLHAAARIPIFSGGASSAESRTYQISTVEMLSRMKGRLNAFQSFDESQHKFQNPSVYSWIDGIMTVNVVKRTRDTRDAATGKTAKQTISETPYLAVESHASKFALVPTDDYFSSGLLALRDLHDSVVGPIELPIRALVRVLSAQTDFKQWIAVPLVIFEP